MEIGEYIRHIRLLRGFTQEDLADICSVKTLYRTENGITQPSNDVLEKLSKRLNVDLVNYRLRKKEEYSLLDKKTMNRILKFKEQKKYKELLILTSVLRSNKEELSLTQYQQVNYYYSMAFYFTSKNPLSTIDFLTCSFSYNILDKINLGNINSLFSPIEIKTLLFISYIYINNQMFDQCSCLLESFKIRAMDLNDCSIEKMHDLLKMTFNKVLSDYRTMNTKTTKIEVENAIRLSERYSLYDRLSRFYWLYSKILFDEKQVEECHFYCNKFLTLCELKNELVILEKYKIVFWEEFGYEHRGF